MKFLQSAANSAKASSSQTKTLIDFWLVGAFAVLIGLGLVMVYSSSVNLALNNFGSEYHFVKRQFFALGLGLGIAYFLFYVPSHVWEKHRGGLLLFGYALLIAVLFVGEEINGSKRWLPLPMFNFQPSELMKIIAILFMAGFLTRHKDEVNERIMAVIRLALPFGLLGALLLLEPDFGATFVIITIVGVMLFIAGAPIKYFIIILLPTLIGGAIAIMKEGYRMERVQSFMDPWDDPFGTDYQLIQSLLAHGQGGWNGLGLGESIQKLSYLPEAHTDYIFSIFAEEFGVIGVILLVALYLFIIYRLFGIGKMAMEKGHAFGGLVVYGVAMWIAVQAAINMSVTLGIAPSKGLTLPLFSYGGSSMLIFLIALGIVFRIDYEARHLPAKETSGTDADAEKASTPITEQTELALNKTAAANAKSKSPAKATANSTVKGAVKRATQGAAKVTGGRASKTVSKNEKVSGSKKTAKGPQNSKASNAPKSRQTNKKSSDASGKNSNSRKRSSRRDFRP